MGRIPWCPALLILALIAPTAFGSSTLNWGTGLKPTPPAGAATNPHLVLNAISCPSAGNCAAVGTYSDGSVTQGMMVSETAGTWAPAQKAVLPGDAASDPSVNVTDISCSSPGNCTAVGSYSNASGVQGLLLTETAGTWAPGVAAILPSGGISGGGNPAVSCSSAGNCTAVSQYQDGSGFHGLLLTQTGGTWADGVEAVLPGDAGTGAVSLSDVSCSSAGNCTAVGNYHDLSTHQQGLLLTEAAGTWAAAAATPPTGAAAIPNTNLYRVDCSGAGACTAAGQYTDSSNHNQGLFVNQTGGAWSTGIQVPAPSDAKPTGNNIFFKGISCPSAGNCSAVGGYTDNANVGQALLLSESSGTWAQGVKAVLPSDNSTSSPYAQTYGMACASAGNCAAVGIYTDTGGHSQGLLVTENAGTWSPAAKATLPADSGPSGTQLLGVACPSLGVCTAVGRYADTSPAQQGLIVSAAPATVTLAASAPATGAIGTAIDVSALSATLAGGSSPGGTITYTVFGPQASAPTDCTSGGTTVGTASVAGNGAYSPSAGFTPTAAGNYWWYASYSGDQGDTPAASSCGASMAKTVVPAPSSPSGDGGGGGGGGPSTPGTPAPPVVTTSGVPSAKAVGATIVVDPGITVACPAAGSTCTATETATAITSASRSTHRRKLVIGRAKFTIPAGKSRRLTFKLNRAGARLLRKSGRLRITVTVISRAGNGKPVTTTKTITVRAPRRKHHR